MAEKPKYTPGTPAPKSGQYKVVGPRGGDRGREVTSTEGHRLPPAQKGERYVLDDATRHKRK
ncbi:YjzC family protein [Kribbella sp. NPDC006257]|uniref:YjzC family protein n=1 Tax=Kribbella sp. NPDC006257 TaxID=3156738 RepID=UPI0033A9CB7C